MNSIVVLELGHFIVGLLFGLKMLSDKQKRESDIKEYMASDKIKDDDKELAKKVAQNIPLILVTYMIVGYFNFFYVFKRLYKRLNK
jgi:hypothetical protein